MDKTNNNTNNNSFALLSLVAIVTVIGIIGLVIMIGGNNRASTTPTYIMTPDGDLGGNAVVYHEGTRTLPDGHTVFYTGSR